MSLTNTILFLSATLIALFSYTPFAFAIDPTSKLPIEIESDRATLDDETGISNYAGNVIITQGQSRLEADNISVNAVNRKIVSIKASGQPAHFIQQAPNETSPTHGYANTIIYTAIDASLKLINNASLVQDNNSFSGEQIEYDIAKRAITAKGDKSIGSRVKIQYFPQDNDTKDTAPETTTINKSLPPPDSTSPNNTPTTPDDTAPSNENP